MRRLLLRISCVAVFVAVLLVAGEPARAELPGKEKTEALPPQAVPQSFADLSAKLLPAVVNISSSQKIEASEEMPEMPEFPPGSPFEDFFKEFRRNQENNGGEGGPSSPVPATSLGSGFIIDAQKGFIVTNNHVIRDADEVRVTLHDDTVLEADIVGKDEKTDLALLKVKTDKHKLTAVSFGNSDVMRVGDWVLAIGNPFGLGGTVTSGIISARKRDINAGPYDDFIQTDASINRGNSGGPMFNLKGEVIGINTAIFSPTGGSVGIGFAIPSNLAKPVIDQLTKYGKTRRGWIGVRIQTVTDEIAEGLGLKETRGALIASVTPGGPAEKAKLKAGDVILELNGQKLDAMRQLPRIVAETPIGTEATILYSREGKTETTKLVVGELEKAEEQGLVAAKEGKGAPVGKGTEIPAFGMTLSDLTPVLRDTYSIPEDAKGAVVTSVKPGSEASEKTLSSGDLILEINQQPVATVAEAKKLIEEAEKAKKTSVLLLVDRQGKGDVRFVALRFKKPAP